MRHSQTLVALSFAVFLSLFVFPLGVRAQLGTASLSGTVTDASGASVPGAQVTIQSTTRKASRQTVTDSAGNYVLPSLLPDSYQLVVSAEGFETKTTTNIQLASGQGSTLNVALQIGAAVTHVKVTEHAPLLQSTTATLGSQLETRMVTNLPLLGRDFTALLSTLPGASPPNLTYSPGDFSPGGGAGTAGGDFAFYGQKPHDNEFLIDGVPNAEYLFNGVPIYPPPEAIAEMTVESGMDSGAYGWASGANINLVTKSGTNAYHGSLWEYARNDVFNARGFFDPSRNTVRWNQFGAAAGGPLAIPHILSKKRAWYVFGWYGGLRIPSGNSYYQQVPTAAELNGNFAGDPTIYNPYTSVVAPDGSLISRQPFAGNQIPVGATSVCRPNPTCIDPNAVLISKTYSPLPNLTTLGPGNTNWLGQQTNRNDYNQWSVRVDHQFGQKDSFFGRFTDARNSQSQDSGFNGIGNLDSRHFSNMVVSDTHTFTPSFLVTARFGWQRFNWNSNSVGPFVAQQAGLCDTFPLTLNGKCYMPSMLLSPFPGFGQSFEYYPENLYTLSADTQKIIGKHMLQFGGTLTRSHITTNNQAGSGIEFTSQPTASLTGANGDGLASFLLGLPSSAGRVIGNTEGDMIANYPALYVQDTWRVTKKLTVNLGVRWDPQITMINQIGSGTFVWETGQYVYDRKNPITGQPANAQRGLIPSDKNNVAPRFGVAYAIDPKTVVRASYGIFYDVLGETAGDQQGNRGNWPFASPQSVGSENTGLPQLYLENPFSVPAQGSSTPLGCQQCLEVYPSATRTPYVQEWSLSVQRQLTPSIMLQTAYFGSHGIDMSGQIVDNTAATPGTNNFQLRQRWPGFPPYVNNGFNQFPSYYDGLSVELRKQYSHSLSFLVAYTWSKAIDVSDSLVASNYYPFIQPTRFNIREFTGPAGYDVTHRLSASYVWDIPGKTGSKVADALMAGWSLSGIATFDSGTPYFVVLNADNANIGSVPGRSTSLPNLVGNPVLSNPTIGEWFNTSAYQIPPFGTQGNAGKHALYSDGLANFDFSLSKKWPFKENKSLDIRGDFFNGFNQHSFGAPNFVADDPSTFGQVTQVRQGGRQIQVSVELHF
ncbi:MAG: carboxypeptidase regulatory-like domain-containing protein [Terriglobia bacterium]